MADFKPKITLELKNAQALVMTPQLREAISLLQLNNIELAGYLENELAENPFLEKDEKSPDGEDGGSDDVAPESAPEGGESDPMDEAFAGEGFDTGSDWANVGKGGSVSFDENDESFTDRVSEKKTLRAHLIEQLTIMADQPADRMIGTLLIDRLDEAGYLREDIEILAQQLGCPKARIDALLKRMKAFDPSGVFAHDLSECLALQLAERDRLDPAMQACLANLQKVADGDLKGLARICGVEVEDVADMIREIRELNPKPSASFDHSIAQTALPDVVMRPIPKHLGGGWKVELNHDTLPRVLVNREYANIVMNAHVGQADRLKHMDKQDKTYLNDRLASANWLVRALDQRAQTILKVASEIIERQDGFFLFGVEFLKPLTLRDIAETVGVHESTVSRVTMNKFIGTPRGLFELKYFFDSGVGAAGGTELAAEAIKAKIKTMIDAETLDTVLSDDDIAEKLKAEGIDIARRTVAKYREAVGIGASSERRRRLKNKSALG
ncbi:MAG: RNA polymerase factor sigma-54 [Rhodospirillales bacterium]|nr:RNA polymerase factor sigma-54 [Alphaproteobacteria bacterium]MCB9986899.1 RNA polymerase factor sigma-54 [Rhodospirillales bacterium]USO08323.1 MAG: RNA polymerase factor sigma-54 [Rhodospirillales bacterium]